MKHNAGFYSVSFESGSLPDEVRADEARPWYSWRILVHNAKGDT